MFESLKQVWKRDPLAVLGVGSAVVAFLLWAVPASVCWQSDTGSRLCLQEDFSDVRLPAVAAFLVVSFILLLLRRR